jgi:hypothetical protein
MAKVKRGRKAKGIAFDPDYVVPTATILREWLNSLGLTTRVACAKCYQRGEPLDWAASVLDRVLDDQPIGDIEIRVLGAVTDVSEAFWRNFEHNYRSGLAAGKTRMG